MSSERDQGIIGFVLAGGRSSRLGQDKVLLPWGDGTLLEYAVARLRRVCETVWVSASRSDLALYLPPAAAGILPDAGPDAGPLGGIVAALEKSATEWGFFLAVDTPFVPVDLLQALANAARKSSAACVIPLAGGRQQPLCGLYRRSLAPGLRRALGEGNYKVMLALEESSATLEFFDVDAFATANLPNTNPENWFLNINTPEDWQQARRFRQLP